MSKSLFHDIVKELSDITNSNNSSFVCGDCRYFGKKMCPNPETGEFNNVCFLYEHSKKQRKFLKAIPGEQIRDGRFLSQTKFLKLRKRKSMITKKRKKRKKSVFSSEGFVICNLRFGNVVKKFLEDIVQREGWKCERKKKGCSKKLFEVRNKDRKRTKVEEDLIYVVTDRQIEFRLVCPACKYIYGFSSDVSKEIRDFVKSLETRRDWFKKPRTIGEREKVLDFVKNQIFNTGFSERPLFIYVKGTRAFRGIARKVKKVVGKCKDENGEAVRYDRVIGAVFHYTKSCLIFDDASFVLIPAEETYGVV